MALKPSSSRALMTSGKTRIALFRRMALRRMMRAPFRTNDSASAGPRGDLSQIFEVSRFLLMRAVDDIAHLTAHLLEDLVTAAPPRDRESEAAKARARAEKRFGRAA